MEESVVTAWVIDHPAHAQALLPFIREGSTSDLFILTKRPDVEHLFAAGEGIIPRRETLWVERPAGVGVGYFRRRIIAFKRYRQVTSALKLRSGSERAILQIVGISCPIEMRAAIKAGIPRRLYISDNEVDQFANRMALPNLSELLIPAQWREDIDGGFVAKVRRSEKPITHFDGNKAHVYLRPATISNLETSAERRILVRRLIGGGIHDEEMVSLLNSVELASLNPEVVFDEHTEGEKLENPWSLPNRTLDYDGVLTQSVTLATEAASLGVPTLLASNAQRGVLDSLIGSGIISLITDDSNSSDSPSQREKISAWLDGLPSRGSEVEWPDTLSQWRTIIQSHSQE
jgi:hypothetical protein